MNASQDDIRQKTGQRGTAAAEWGGEWQVRVARVSLVTKGRDGRGEDFVDFFSQDDAMGKVTKLAVRELF